MVLAVESIKTKRQTVTRIPDVLEEQGRKVVWFCGAMGMSISSYHMREQGKRPVTIGYLTEAARVLGVPVKRLRRA